MNFKEAKIAVIKGAIMKRPLSFELYGLGSRLYMTVKYVFRKLYNDRVQWLIKKYVTTSEQYNIIH